VVQRGDYDVNCGRVAIGAFMPRAVLGGGHAVDCSADSGAVSSLSCDSETRGQTHNARSLYQAAQCARANSCRWFVCPSGVHRGIRVARFAACGDVLQSKISSSKNFIGRVGTPVSRTVVLRDHATP
jgi:hypothetical protein